jgi:hypothetical protein
VRQAPSCAKDITEHQVSYECDRSCHEIDHAPDPAIKEIQTHFQQPYPLKKAADKARREGIWYVDLWMDRKLLIIPYSVYPSHGFKVSTSTSLKQV